jgi:hypothetical protein
MAQAPPVYLNLIGDFPTMRAFHDFLSAPPPTAPTTYDAGRQIRIEEPHLLPAIARV